MFTLALVWALLVIAEGLGYARLTLRPGLRHTVAAGLLLVLLLASTALKVWADWQVWAVVCVLSVYRIINLARFWYARLPAPRLRSVSLRAHVWLVTMQAIVLLAGSAVAHWRWGYQLLNIVAGLQLAAAVVLLRATTHTWRHAAAPAGDIPLADRELPSLSVLVPARNETESLEECLQMLTASDYPKLEILVLDDCSATRRTPEIVRQFARSGVRFIGGEAPDESHWLAKNYAYERLAKEASGDLLLFCGVDMLPKPQSFRRLASVLEGRNKTMLSVMPLRQKTTDGKSLFQAMRYYWELCLPRRFFKRPPVLSTCWLIRREALTKLGGFEAVSHSINPEATFARQAVTTDSYSFIRSDDALGIYSDKPAAEQYDTSVRVRYPQLHRRLELVAATAAAEVVFLLGPAIGLLLAADLKRTMAYAALWCVSLLCLLVTYGFASVGVRLASPWYGWLLMPVAFILDLAVLHVSLWRYEFGTVEWKGRNVCLPVMQLEPDRPAAPDSRRQPARRSA